MVWSQTCLRFNRDSKQTHRSLPETWKVRWILSFNTFFGVFHWSAASYRCGSLFPPQPLHPSPHPCDPGTLWKWTIFFFCSPRQAIWTKKWLLTGVSWKSRFGDVAAHVQLSVLFCREKRPRCFVQRQHRERLTRQQRDWMDWRQSTTYKTGGRFTRRFRFQDSSQENWRIQSAGQKTVKC